MLAEWIPTFRRTFKEFLDDDCMGLAREVAYSALLAFFPATAFLLGLLGVLHLYDQVQSLLATVAPHGVITFIEGLQRDQSGSAKVFALVAGGAGAIWAASGAMGSVIKAVNRAYDLECEYLGKPFAAEALMAKVDSARRMTAGAESPAPVSESLAVG